MESIILTKCYSQSCSYFETFCSFIEWAVKLEADSDKVDHYSDDIFFVGESNTNQCQNLMDIFINVCERMGVPIAHEKTEGPKTIIEYLGLTLCNVLFVLLLFWPLSFLSVFELQILIISLITSNSFKWF